MAPTDQCLECAAPLTIVAAESTARTTVLRCPECAAGFISHQGELLRSYARGPLIGPMYSLIFESDPPSRAAELGEKFFVAADVDEVDFMIRACEVELRSPSIRLSDAYDFALKPDEETLREFLRLFADHLRQRTSSDD